MTQEEKQLLLVDLCARLPYGVKVKTPYNDAILRGIVDRKGVKTTIDYTDIVTDKQTYPIRYIKPYLRPMSSMTEEEKKEYIEYAGYEIEESVNGRHYEYYLKDFCGTPDNPSVNANGVDWVNKKMFDFRGLIPRGLALSTEVFNPYED